MYGVLYAVSPELFPAKDRGTGNGLTATSTRVFGILVRVSDVPAAFSFPYMITGPHYRAVRQPRHSSSRLCIRGADIGGGRHGPAPPVRASWQGLAVIFGREVII